MWDTEFYRKGSRFPVAKHLLEKPKLLYMNCVYLVALPTPDSALHAWLLYLVLLPRRPSKLRLYALQLFLTVTCAVMTSVLNYHVAKLFYHSACTGVRSNDDKLQLGDTQLGTPGPIDFKLQKRKNIPFQLCLIV